MSWILSVRCPVFLQDPTEREDSAPPQRDANSLTNCHPRALSIRAQLAVTQQTLLLAVVEIDLLNASTSRGPRSRSRPSIPIVMAVKGDGSGTEVVRFTAKSKICFSRTRLVERPVFPDFRTISEKPPNFRKNLAVFAEKKRIESVEAKITLKL